MSKKQTKSVVSVPIVASVNTRGSEKHFRVQRSTKLAASIATDFEAPLSHSILEQSNSDESDSEQHTTEPSDAVMDATMARILAGGSDNESDSASSTHSRKDVPESELDRRSAQSYKGFLKYSASYINATHP